MLFGTHCLVKFSGIRVRGWSAYCSRRAGGHRCAAGGGVMQQVEVNG